MPTCWLPVAEHTPDLRPGRDIFPEKPADCNTSVEVLRNHDCRRKNIKDYLPDRNDFLYRRRLQSPVKSERFMRRPSRDTGTSIGKTGCAAPTGTSPDCPATGAATGARGSA